MHGVPYMGMIGAPAPQSTSGMQAFMPSMIPQAGSGSLLQPSNMIPMPANQEQQQQQHAEPHGKRPKRNGQ